ncbi:MAG: T9SS type A sorting domain-containing protein, partial [Bacteroidales bacterium]|nr:T9SS type A sorting domain-containing protein [Bacteroidales bacterium]
MKKLTIIIFALFSILSIIPGFAQVDDGLPLPFLEQWNSGTFGTNNWLQEAENWSINGNEGNPGPCAEFTWDPIQNDYSISLESDQFQADYITEGRIYLDFDIKLDDFSGDGLEQMKVQVWNWGNQVWTTVNTYSNEDGDFDWASEHLDITSLAMGEVFKIRFTAQGENSLHIISWFIDNIHLYRVCEAPIDLTAECDTNLNTIELQWAMPWNNNSDEWIHWDDGVNTGIAFGTGAAVEFDVAARYEPAQLAIYEGASITEIAFFAAELQCTYNLRVWVGPMAEFMVVDQLVPDPIIGEWNYVALTTPLPLDITQDLWVGYYVNAQTGYPAGADNGPAIDGYGNMINFGGWQTTLEINPEFNYNWNIAAHLVTETGIPMLLNVFTPDNGSRDLMGFNIYRSVDGSEYEHLDFTNGNAYLEEGELNIGTLYCFMVTAVYESATDQCESGFSNEACVVCGTFVPEEESLLDLKIYPNPASDVLFIESSEEKIESVSVIDIRGETVKQWNGETVEHWNNGTLELPLPGLAPGLYLVRVETGSGV